MNRWRQRLAELHGEGGALLHVAVPSCVHIVQNVQNPVRRAAFEHFEHIEQPTEPAAAFVKEAAVAVPLPASRREAEAEGIAIVEHHRGTFREWVEGVTRLNPETPLADVPPLLWQRLIRDSRRFLDSRFCAHAAALGWSALDLFGCDQRRPYARIDQAGLLWLLNGNRLVLIAENVGVIETPTGAHQTYRRKPSAPGRVLAWELMS